MLTREEQQQKDTMLYYHTILLSQLLVEYYDELEETSVYRHKLKSQVKSTSSTLATYTGSALDLWFKKRPKEVINLSKQGERFIKTLAQMNPIYIQSLTDAIEFTLKPENKGKVQGFSVTIDD